MQLIIIYGCFLSIMTYFDIKERKISVISLIISAVTGIGVQFYMQTESIYSIVGGCFIGAGLWIISYFTKESIGKGDVYFIGITAIYFGFFKTMEFLIWALCFSFFASMIFIICKKAGRKTEIPFFPFLLIAYVLMAVTGRLM